MSNDREYGKGRHEEHMFSLHGTKDTGPFRTRSGMEINIETLLRQGGAGPEDAAETATAVYKGLQRYSDNPPEKQAEFVSMMIGPLLKEKGAGFTDKPDPQKLAAAVDTIMDMAARSFGGAPAAPGTPRGNSAGGPAAPPPRPPKGP